MNKNKLQQYSDSVYWLPANEETDRPVLGVIIGQECTLILDAGNSPTHAQLLLSQLPETAPPIAYVCLTHWHWDHVFGTASFPNASIIAHRQTKAMVAQMATWDWSDAALDERVAAGIEIQFCRDMMKLEMPDRSDLVLRPPDIAFQQQLELDLGDLTCLMVHVGGDHAADSSILYVPEEKVLFAGDAPYWNIYAQKPHYTTDKLFPLLDTLLSFQAKAYFWGHDPKPMPKAEFVDFARITRRTGELVTTGKEKKAILKQLKQENFNLFGDEDELIDTFKAGLI